MTLMASVTATPPPTDTNSTSNIPLASNTTAISGTTSSSSSSSSSSFPYFTRFPPEVQDLIWKQSWQARTVTIKRTIDAHRSDSASTVKKAKAQSRQRHRDRQRHSNAVMRHEWGIPSQKNAKGAKLSNAERKLAGLRPETILDDLLRVTTVTWSDVDMPVSARVSHASREYTLGHYKLAFGLPGGVTFIRFNFDLDTLKVPCHVQLWRAFSKQDLGRLQRLMVPESKHEYRENRNLEYEI